VPRNQHKTDPAQVAELLAFPMLTYRAPHKVAPKALLARILPRIRRPNFLPLYLLSTYVAGIAILGTGCASYAPRPLVVHQSTLPAAIKVGNFGTIDLRIVSFNVWGLPGWMNGASAQRYSLIARQLEELQPDLVLLQEVWTKEARASAPSGRQWSTAWSSGQANFFKENGLLTISRNPILGGEFHPFHASAFPDSLVKKGALKVTIQIGDGLRLNVWNVHLQAGLADTTRSRQITELVHWVQDAHDGQIADLVAGDFNCTPDSPQYQTLFQQIGPSVQSISGEPGFTTFDGLSSKPGAGETLDHAFIRILSSVEGVKASPRPIFTAESMKDRFSDHLGVEVALRLSLSTHAGPGFDSLASGPAPTSMSFHAANP
jgi:endonuclease/exonuclease/phosphatase family metal-dependent hydrolase